MCLDANKRSTKATEKLFDGNYGRMSFYKMLVAYVDGKGVLHLCSPYTKGKGFEWKAGWNKSTERDGRCHFDNDCDTYSISRGFHVFFCPTTYRRYKNDAKFFASNQRVVSVRVVGFKKHLIASGTFGWYPSVKSAAFSKLFVPKSEIDRIKKLLKKK